MSAFLWWDPFSPLESLSRNSSYFLGIAAACSSHFCGILGIALPTSLPPPPEAAKLRTPNPQWEQPGMYPEPLEKSQIVVPAPLPRQGALGFHQHSGMGSFPVFLLAPTGIPARTGILAVSSIPSSCFSIGKLFQPLLLDTVGSIRHSLPGMRWDGRRSSLGKGD